MKNKDYERIIKEQRARIRELERFSGIYSGRPEKGDFVSKLCTKIEDLRVALHSEKEQHNETRGYRQKAEQQVIELKRALGWALVYADDALDFWGTEDDEAIELERIKELLK